MELILSYWNHNGAFFSCIDRNDGVYDHLIISDSKIKIIPIADVCRLSPIASVNGDKIDAKHCQWEKGK